VVGEFTKEAIYAAHSEFSDYEARGTSSVARLLDSRFDFSRFHSLGAGASGTSRFRKDCQEHWVGTWSTAVLEPNLVVPDCRTRGSTVILCVRPYTRALRAPGCACAFPRSGPTRRIRESQSFTWGIQPAFRSASLCQSARSQFYASAAERGCSAERNRNPKLSQLDKLAACCAVPLREKKMKLIL